MYISRMPSAFYINSVVAKSTYFPMFEGKTTSGVNSEGFAYVGSGNIAGTKVVSEYGWNAYRILLDSQGPGTPGNGYYWCVVQGGFSRLRLYYQWNQQSGSYSMACGLVKYSVGDFQSYIAGLTPGSRLDQNLPNSFLLGTSFGFSASNYPYCQEYDVSAFDDNLYYFYMEVISSNPAYHQFSIKDIIMEV